MARRIYSETVKNWAIKAGIPIASIGSIAFLIFMYMQSIGAIDITGMSGDMRCSDTCYIYINFTANEDVFIYPVDYDPYGRNTPIEFNPAVESWRLERSWGTNWRNLPLDKSCTGTWCGLSNADDKRIFSVAFRKGRDYQIRIVVNKRPLETIKWWSDDWEIEDPLLLGAEFAFKEECLKENTMRISNKVIDSVEKIVHKNGTVEDRETFHYNTTYVTNCISYKEIIKFDDKVVDSKDLNIGIKNDGIKTIIDDKRDGNGDGICQKGETCCEITDKVICTGFNKKGLRLRLESEGIR